MTKTAKGLVEYAIAQLGKPYWYGTVGQAASKSLYNQRKGDYPNYYKWSYTPEIAGQKVHDCGGLIKGYLWCDSPDDVTPAYNPAQDRSANQMRDYCTTGGNISTIPEVPGVLVFYNNHVGIYIGNGEVIEARGHAYGVVKTKLDARPWKTWGYYPDLTYDNQTSTTVKTTTVKLPVLKKGDKNDSVKSMQLLLLGYGYEMKSTNGKTKYGADGSFGGATERALIKYQSDNNLEVDGKCGPQSWSSLLGVK